MGGNSGASEVEMFYNQQNGAHIIAASPSMVMQAEQHLQAMGFHFPQTAPGAGPGTASGLQSLSNLASAAQSQLPHWGAAYQGQQAGPAYSPSQPVPLGPNSNSSIGVRCPVQHSMEMRTTPPPSYMSGAVQCDVCGANDVAFTSSHFFHCSLCKYDECDKCGAQQLEAQHLKAQAAGDKPLPLKQEVTMLEARFEDLITKAKLIEPIFDEGVIEMRNLLKLMALEDAEISEQLDYWRGGEGYLGDLSIHAQKRLRDKIQHLIKNLDSFLETPVPDLAYFAGEGDDY